MPKESWFDTKSPFSQPSFYPQVFLLTLGMFLPDLGYWIVTSCFVMSTSKQEGEREVCEKCGFETNSPAIFVLHKKNCPRV